MRFFMRLIFAALFVYSGIYTWNRFHAAAEHSAQTSTDSETAPEAAGADPQKKPYVSIKGPLANLVSGQKADDSEDVAKPYKSSAEDHIEDSPVGTSSRVLHRTFTVGRLVHLAFDIPPHAVNPHFHGTFSSYAGAGDSPTHDEDANVDLLLMNEQQYAAFAAGHDPEVLMIADTSHYQDINFDLAPSRDQPVKYHLVFRNTPGGPARKIVKADFTVDF